MTENNPEQKTFENIDMPELVWPDKKTQVKRHDLPFQDVETLTEDRILKQNRLDQWTEEAMEWPKNYPKDWKNRLIWGDNKYVMSSLLNQGWAGKIDLIYIDPPFATGADFSIKIDIDDETATKESNVIEEKAYRDTWGKGIETYLQSMYERLVLMRELLSEEGTIFVHTDYRVSSHIKIIMDEIFGKKKQINEIIWCYKSGGIPSGNLPKKHDTIQWYSKGDKWTFNPIYTEYTEGTKERGLTDVKGDNYKLRDEGALMPDWWEIQPILSPTAYERTGFPTQKPEKLLGQIIKMATKKGDIIADFFCGSGTTAAVSEKLGRKWIMSDLSKFAIHISRKRLLDIHKYSNGYDNPCRPFVIQNMGNYQKQKFIENGHPPIEDYIKFILKLYGAESIEGYSFLHGKKGRRYIHVGSVDSIVTNEEIVDAIEEMLDGPGGEKITFLAWDYEMEIDNNIKQIEKNYDVDINVLQIPKEASEVSKVNIKGDEIKFLHMNSLDIVKEIVNDKVILELNDFIIADPRYLPEKIREEIDDYLKLVDYWAVDFDYKNDTFHNMWQNFRTRQDKTLDKKCSHTYKEPGSYNILVKVIDVMGNDTNKLIKVDIQ